jgi:hypothetical protein
MATSRRKFSWNRLISRVIPNFTDDNAEDDATLSPTQADAIVKHQLALPFPRYLSEESFFVAGVTDNKPYSLKVHKALLKNGLIRAPPAAGHEDDMTVHTVNTQGITKNFANQIAIISVHAQRHLVGLLFFWEEECTRWRLLADEEREILRALDVEGCDRESLAVVLSGVEIRKGLLPSQRAEDTSNVGSGVGHSLPAYA